MAGFCCGGQDQKVIKISEASNAGSRVRLYSACFTAVKSTNCYKPDSYGGRPTVKFITTHFKTKATSNNPFQCSLPF